MTHKWGNVFKIGLSKCYRRQPLKNVLSPLLNTLSQMIFKERVVHILAY